MFPDLWAEDLPFMAAVLAVPRPGPGVQPFSDSHARRAPPCLPRAAGRSGRGRRAEGAGGGRRGRGGAGGCWAAPGVGVWGEVRAAEAFPAARP